MEQIWDAIIIGGGPAGSSVSQWYVAQNCEVINADVGLANAVGNVPGNVAQNIGQIRCVTAPGVGKDLQLQVKIGVGAGKTSAAFAAGMGIAYLVFYTSPGTYADFSFVTGLDALEAMVKAFAYGAVIPIIAGACGLATHGGSAGVGRATTQAVVVCSLAVIVLDFFIGAAVLMVR